MVYSDVPAAGADDSASIVKCRTIRAKIAAVCIDRSTYVNTVGCIQGHVQQVGGGIGGGYTDPGVHIDVILCIQGERGSLDTIPTDSSQIDIDRTVDNDPSGTASIIVVICIDRHGRAILE